MPARSSRGKRVGLTYNLSGPATVSGTERAALVSELTGKPFEFAVVEEAQLRAGMMQADTPPFVVDAIVGMQRAFSLGAYDIVTGDVEQLTGQAPRPFRAALADALVRCPKPGDGEAPATS